MKFRPHPLTPILAPAALAALCLAIPLNASAEEPASAAAPSAEAGAVAKPADAPNADAKPCAGRGSGDSGDCCDEGGSECCADGADCCKDGADCCGGGKGDGCCEGHGEGGKPCEGHGEGGKPCEGKGEGAKPCEGGHGGHQGHSDHGGHGTRDFFGGGIFGGFAGLKPIVLLQTQVGLLAGDDNMLVRGDVVEHPGSFVMRRARLGLAGHATERVTFALSLDLARNPLNGSSPLTDAFVSARWLKHQDLTVGAHMVPFSRYAMMNSGEQALAQMPKAVDAMAPYRQVGASIHGKYEIVGLQWWAGAYNSYERNINFFAGAVENSFISGNRTGGITVAGRVQLEPLGTIGPLAGDRGARNKKFRFEVGGGALYGDAGATTSFAVSGDVHLKWYGAHLLFEYLIDSATPKDLPTVTSVIPATLKRSAIIAEAGYAWRILNAAVRAEIIDPNSTVKDNHDETVISGAVGVQLPKYRARVQLQYDHRQESTGTALKNDTLFAQFQLKL